MGTGRHGCDYGNEGNTPGALVSCYLPTGIEVLSHFKPYYCIVTLISLEAKNYKWIKSCQGRHKRDYF